MQYRIDPKSHNKLSILGFGCMRFPRGLGPIDMKKTEQLVMEAIASGVNYFDCAYVYPGCEEALGAVLAKNDVRQHIYIATKLPPDHCHTYEDFDRLFSIQLARLHTEYIDYYLMHNISDTSIWARLCALGIEQWIAQKKANGQIRQIGFSFHGTQDAFIALLDAYAWDFCQIQYNYVNVHYQAGEAGLKRAAAKGLPVIIMEPLLGGRLANNLPQKARAAFSHADGQKSPAQWALQWLFDQSEVTVVLSGMNDREQLMQNVQIADECAAGMLTLADRSVYAQAVTEFQKSYKVPCTGCNYCMPCPHNVNIPGCFAAYNISYAAGMMAGLQLYFTGVSSFSPHKDYSPGLCVKCGACEKRCPQHIAIPQELERAKKRLEPLPLRAIKSIVLRKKSKAHHAAK